MYIVLQNNKLIVHVEGTIPALENHLCSVLVQEDYYPPVPLIHYFFTT